ncbi:MAG: cyclic pyranopterin monophosphate synthase MoaC, partial [Bacillota bacterium]|nr:cyclic pyranopterin monophosphate synthase MoaC [Bacillota bacterium]
KLTHFNEQGLAKMVDVGDKEITDRMAVAQTRVIVNKEAYEIIKSGTGKKGNVLATAQIAGIMAAKKTSDIIPMCHNIPLTGADIEFYMDDNNHVITINASVKCTGKTGVEMEALTAASVAALTIYDMTKAVQKDIVITDTKLLLKDGGKSGRYESK